MSRGVLSLHRFASSAIRVSLVLSMILCVQCASNEENQAFADATLTFSYLQKNEGQFVFHAGPFAGGTAVVGGMGEAFWVKDGRVHAANEAARRAAPEAPVLPPSLDYEDLVAAATASGD